MKRLNMKKLKSCFGRATAFFKEKERECKKCQFKRKCLNEINGMRKE